MNTSIEDRLRAYAQQLDEASAEQDVAIRPPRRTGPQWRVGLAVGLAAAAVVGIVFVARRDDTPRVTDAPPSTESVTDTTIPDTTVPDTTTTDTAGSPAAVGGWTDIAPSPLAAREDAGVVWTGSEFLVWGGRDGNFMYQQGAAYDPTTDTWRSISSNQWAGIGSMSVWTGTQFVVVWKLGGAVYDLPTDTWSQDSLASLDPDEYGGFLAVAWFDGEVVALTTHRDAGSTMSRLRVLATVPGDDSWRTIADTDVEYDAQMLAIATPAGFTVSRVAADGADAQLWTYEAGPQMWVDRGAYTAPEGRLVDSFLPVATDTGWAAVASLRTAAGESESAVVTDGGASWITSSLGESFPVTQAVSAGDDRLMLFGTDQVALVSVSAGSIVDRWAAEGFGRTLQALAWNGTQLFAWGGRSDGPVLATGHLWTPNTSIPTN